MTQNNELLEAYYEELDPEKRLPILEEYLTVAGADDPAAEYRRELYTYRYTNKKDPSRKIDQYLWAILNFLYIYRNSVIFPGRFAKEVKKTMGDIACGDKIYEDEVFADAFRMEARNAIKRYFDTCKSDGYHKKLFGTIASSADEKEKQRVLDTWRMSYGVAERLHLEKEMALFCQAVSEEFRLSRADGRSLESAYSAFKK